MSRDEAKAARTQRLKDGAGAEEFKNDWSWRWHHGHGDYVQDDPNYPDGIQNNELERLRFNEELREKVDGGELTWEEFIQQVRKKPPIDDKGVGVLGNDEANAAGDATNDGQQAAPENK